MKCVAYDLAASAESETQSLLRRGASPDKPLPNFSHPAVFDRFGPFQIGEALQMECLYQSAKLFYEYSITSLLLLKRFLGAFYVHLHWTDSLQ